MTRALHETNCSETILRLREGEAAPVGFEIKRVVGIYDEPMGTGTNTRRIYVVACRDVGGLHPYNRRSA